MEASGKAYIFYVLPLSRKRFSITYAEIVQGSLAHRYPIITEELYQTTLYLAKVEQVGDIVTEMHCAILQGYPSHPIHLVHSFGGHYRNRHEPISTYCSPEEVS